MQLEGSRLVESINNKFTATMTNAVRWREADAASAITASSSFDESICVRYAWIHESRNVSSIQI